MPELPEVEITARRLGAALAGAEVESALAPGMVALKSFDPPLDALVGRDDRRGAPGRQDAGRRVRRRRWPLLVHLMSAGRLQVFDKRASLKDRRSRVLIRLADGRELRLREFGTKQRAWAKLLPAGDGRRATRWSPRSAPRPGRRRRSRTSPRAIDQPRHLHPLLRDQRAIAGIGRSWVDEILWEARLSPFKQGADLDDEEVERLHAALAVLGGAIDHYEEVIGDEVPDKMPMPLQVHRREGEPCPRCGTTIEAVHYAEYG